MDSLDESHWMMAMLQNIDVGLTVLDRHYRVKVWNGFMENHSGISPSQARDKSLFDLFPNLPEQWFRAKVEPVFLLNNRAFTIWEQRPYLFPFRNYRSVTGMMPHMYQNVTISPLVSLTGTVDHISLQIYDVTDIAYHRLELEKANTKLQQLSRTDGLTLLNNRAYWEQRFQAEFRRFQRTRITASLVMLDIDHFKRFNDTYGHPAGDQVIRHVSQLLRDTQRETDISGRYGGEEFAVLLVNSDAEAARVFAERLRRNVESSEIEWKGQRLRVTISLGIAAAAPRFTSHDQWIEAADKALYQAKQDGRNRFSLAPVSNLPHSPGPRQGEATGLRFQTD